MMASVEHKKRYIRGTRPLRIVVEDSQKFKFPTNQDQYEALKAQGLDDSIIFDSEIKRIQPIVDYSMGGGPITAYEFSGMALEKVSRLIPLNKMILHGLRYTSPVVSFPSTSSARPVSCFS